MSNKNCELTSEIRAEITKLLLNFDETEQSKIFDNKEFGYSKITVERPLELSVDLSQAHLEEFEVACRTADDMPVMRLLEGAKAV